MSFSFANLKRDARRAVHDTLAVSAEFQSGADDPVSMSVRFHSTRTLTPFGAAGADDYAEIIERIDRVIFDVDALAAAAITPQRGDTVLFSDYGITVTLDVRAPTDGPVTEAWTVTR